MKKVVSYCFIICLFVFLYFDTIKAEQAAESGSKEYETFVLGEIYVTAEKMPALRDVTVTTEITAADIKTTNSHTVAEALNYIRGIRVSTGYKKSFCADSGLLSSFSISRDSKNFRIVVENSKKPTFLSLLQRREFRNVLKILVLAFAERAELYPE